MKTKRYFSKMLNQFFTRNEKGINFEDGINYSNNEIKRLQNVDTDSKVAIHNLKKVFSGELIDGERKKKRDNI